MDALVSVNSSWGVVFLIQTTVGIFSNSLLLSLYKFPLLIAQLLTPRNLIVNQLVISNYVVLFPKGIPQTVATFGLKSFLDDTGWKVILHVYRVSRGACLSTTSLLSGFQAIKVCHNTSGWVTTRIRSPVHVGTCCFLCWILQLLLNIYITMIVTGPLNSKNLTAEGLYRDCSSPTPERLTFWLTAWIFFLSDSMSVGLMAWASGSTVLVLQRHKQQVRHIHSCSLSPRPSHEDRATRTILVLVSTFISLHFLASVFSLCIMQTANPGHGLLNTSAVSGLPGTQPPCAQSQGYSGLTVLLHPLDKEKEWSVCGLSSLQDIPTFIKFR